MNRRERAELSAELLEGIARLYTDSTFEARDEAFEVAAHMIAALLVGEVAAPSGPERVERVWRMLLNAHPERLRPAGARSVGAFLAALVKLRADEELAVRLLRDFLFAADAAFARAGHEVLHRSITRFGQGHSAPGIIAELVRSVGAFETTPSDDTSRWIDKALRGKGRKRVSY